MITKISNFKILLESSITDPKVSKEILKTINTLGQEDGTIYDIKIIDKRPGKENTKNIAVKVEGDNLIPVTTTTNEGIKSNIIKGLVCTILASGMVSCTKQDNIGFGYNNSAKVTTYQINPSSKNSKTIFAYSPDGEKSAVVDSTASQSSWSGSGTIFKIKPTAEQLKIMAFGNMINTEINRNNGRGTDGYIIDVTDIEVKENPGYSGNSGKPLNSIEEDGNYITGKNYKESNPKAWQDFLNKFDILEAYSEQEEANDSVDVNVSKKDLIKIEKTLKSKFGNKININYGINKYLRGPRSYRTNHPILFIKSNKKTIEISIGGDHEIEYGWEVISPSKIASFKSWDLDGVIKHVEKELK